MKKIKLTSHQSEFISSDEDTIYILTSLEGFSWVINNFGKNDKIDLSILENHQEKNSDEEGESTIMSDILNDLENSSNAQFAPDIVQKGNDTIISFADHNITITLANYKKYNLRANNFISKYWQLPYDELNIGLVKEGKI